MSLLDRVNKIRVPKALKSAAKITGAMLIVGTLYFAFSDSVLAESSQKFRERKPRNASSTSIPLERFGYTNNYRTTVDSLRKFPEYFKHAWLYSHYKTQILEFSDEDREPNSPPPEPDFGVKLYSFFRLTPGEENFMKDEFKVVIRPYRSASDEQRQAINYLRRELRGLRAREDLLAKIEKARKDHSASSTVSLKTVNDCLDEIVEALTEFDPWFKRPDVRFENVSWDEFKKNSSKTVAADMTEKLGRYLKETIENPKFYRGEDLSEGRDKECEDLFYSIARRIKENDGSFCTKSKIDRFTNAETFDFLGKFFVVNHSYDKRTSKYPRSIYSAFQRMAGGEKVGGNCVDLSYWYQYILIRILKKNNPNLEHIHATPCSAFYKTKTSEAKAGEYGHQFVQLMNASDCTTAFYCPTRVVLGKKNLPIPVDVYLSRREFKELACKTK